MTPLELSVLRDKVARTKLSAGRSALAALHEAEHRATKRLTRAELVARVEAELVDEVEQKRAEVELLRGRLRRAELTNRVLEEEIEQLKRGLPDFRRRYMSEDERVEARRATWRMSKRRKRLGEAA